MRIRRDGFSEMNAAGAVTYHCVSRVVGRQFLFGDKEKAVFVKMMRMYEDFCAMEVLSYCVMSNHFHILVRIPKQEGEEISDGEFERRLLLLHKKDKVALVMKQLRKCRKNKAVKMIRELKGRYTCRMGNISEFMRSLKQRFSRWYNKCNSRVGTLWEDRYGVTLVGPGWSTRVVAAYIDLNPLRAGMVEDPVDYRYSSYGEAVAKRSGLAAERLLEMMNSCEEGTSLLQSDTAGAADTKEALAKYRVLLAEEGMAEDPEASPVLGESKAKRMKKAKGFSKQEVKKILKQGGELSLSQLLRCKTRYFSAGFAVGSKLYVEGVLDKLRGKGRLFEKRKSGATKIKHAAECSLVSLRNLQRDSVKLE